MARSRTANGSENSSTFFGIEADFGPENADTFRRDLRAEIWSVEAIE